MSSVTRIVAIVEEDTGKKTYRSHQQSYNIPIILCYYCLLWLLGRCSPTLLQRFLKDFHYGPKMESVTAKANAGLPCLALAMLCCAQWNKYFLKEHLKNFLEPAMFCHLAWSKMESAAAKANAGLPCLALAMLCRVQWNKYFLREH